MSSSRAEKDVRDSEAGPSGPAVAPVDLEPIRAAIKGIRFGEVRIVIQDGRVIQIDRMEKQRIR